MTPYQRAARGQAIPSADTAVPPAVAAELRSVAHGNPEREERLRTALTRLAAGTGGPDLQEMAAEVLRGRVTLRHAVLSGAYSEALQPAVEQLLHRTDASARAKPERPGTAPVRTAPTRQSPGHCLTADNGGPAAVTGPQAVTGAEPPASGRLASRLAAAQARYAGRGPAGSARRRER